MEGCMKGSGLRISNMVKDFKSFRMGQPIKEITREGSQKVVVDISGKMVSSTRENGSMVWNMVQVFGEELKEILILDSGGKAKLMAMVYILGLTEIGIKVSLKNAWSMVKVYRDLQMAIAIKVTIKMENLVVMESTFGRQEVSLKGSLKMDWDVAKVYGKKGLVEVKNMKEGGKEIKNKTMGYLLGLTVQYIKAIL